jgi:signal transduction histidine kinase/CheY-like chemotaxis protein
VQSEELIQRQIQRLNGLRLIDAAISSSVDLETTLGMVLQQVTSLLSVDACAVVLVTSDRETVQYAASRGFYSHSLNNTRQNFRESYASQAVLKCELVHIANDGSISGGLHKANETFVDYYGAPLLVKGDIKGVLEIYHRTPLQIDSEWLDFLETLAGQAAIAIENAQLLHSLQTAKEELEQRVAERTAELERANRIKDEFLANMSHELRTPLNSILGLSEILLEERRGSLNDYQTKSLEMIEGSGRHLLELINDVLDLSKVEAGKFDFYPQSISIDEVCRSSIAFVKAQATKKFITLTYIQEPMVSTCFADPRRLKQILVNLLTNAVKFTPTDGNVTLRVNVDPEHQIIQFTVIDTGVGIAPKDLERLFQRFVQVDSSLTRQYEGTGLGLTLVQTLTDLHGGSVTVESEVGQGSRFTVSLPWSDGAEAEPHQIAPVFENEGRQKTENIEIPLASAKFRGKILLAEDNMASILTIGEYLESHGFEVVVAHDGIEAIAKAEAFNPDVILMDIQMPVMNGLDAVARLRGKTRFAKTPIITLTALAMPGDRERCLLAGASEYMSKPVSLKSLKQMIDRFLEV